MRARKPLTCNRVHDDGDPLLGQPLCSDCYEDASHVLWQCWAPELWSRFTIGSGKPSPEHRSGCVDTQLGEVLTTLRELVRNAVRPRRSATRG